MHAAQLLQRLGPLAPGAAPPARRRGAAPRHRAPPPPRAAAAAPPAPPATEQGHSALLQGLGQVGDVAPTHLPWLLRLAHVKSRASGGDSGAALQQSARGLLLWAAALERGLLLDDDTVRTLVCERGSPWGEYAGAFAGSPAAAAAAVRELAWPDEPLRGVLVRRLATLGVARFAARYPAVLDALARALLELTVKYYKAVLGEADEAARRETDEHGNVYMTAAEIAEAESARRAAAGLAHRNPNVVAPPPAAAAAAAAAAAEGGAAAGADAAAAAEAAAEAEAEAAAERAGWAPDRLAAEDLVAALVAQWRAPIDALGKAGRAFEGLEALLGGGRGGGAFDVGSNMWSRRGWAEMDRLRSKLEDVRELRDLVRSLGRGGGWGPLRRAPVQRLDMRGRPGLLRTVLEAQETRGLTRSDDISRLLPSEAATLARGRTVRPAKLLFYARLAEKGLQTYERDGWGEFPTQVNLDRREVRPTADRGPILLCVDTSGSMRGARETVAKALALECMRAAKAQERGCYVFAFAGPSEVRELELNMDAKSVANLLDFLEKTFNGGSDFNAPVQKCLDRMLDAKWANSDVLLVSDGELRQPGPEIMRKLAGAKDKMGLRVHGLIVGAPPEEQRRSDPAVLRGLCTHVLPSGKAELLVHTFESWASVRADADLAAFDWDDAAGNAARKAAGLRLEKMRNAEIKRRRLAARGLEGAPDKRALRMPGKDASDFDVDAKKGGSGGSAAAAARAKRMPGRDASSFE